MYVSIYVDLIFKIIEDCVRFRKEVCVDVLRY